MADDTLMARHDTLVLERTYRASPGRVFAAWSDPDIRKVWMFLATAGSSPS